MAVIWRGYSYKKFSAVCNISISGSVLYGARCTGLGHIMSFISAPLSSFLCPVTTVIVGTVDADIAGRTLTPLWYGNSSLGRPVVRWSLNKPWRRRGAAGKLITVHEQWRGVGAGRREDRCRSLPTTVVSDLKSVHSSSVARSRDHRPHVLSQSSARRDTTGSSARHAIVNLSHKPIQYNTIQYKICKAPCCRGFRGAGEQDS